MRIDPDRGKRELAHVRLATITAPRREAVARPRHPTTQAAHRRESSNRASRLAFDVEEILMVRIAPSSGLSEIPVAARASAASARRAPLACKRETARRPSPLDRRCA